MAETDLRGRLLVAAPSLHDPNFARSVILIAEHGDGGAMGLVLNRPSQTLVGEAVPELTSLSAGDEPIFVGGPVATESVLALAEVEDPDDASELVLGDQDHAAGEVRVVQRWGGDEQSTPKSGLGHRS